MRKIAVWGIILLACTVTACSGWKSHQDPAGFALQVPGGWKVSTEGGRITAAGPNMERVTILPLKLEGNLNADMAREALVDISRQFWPGQRWEMPKSGWQFGDNGVRAVGGDESTLRETTALWWTNTPQGAVGFFYSVAAQPAQYKAMEPVFVRVLQSFRVTPPGLPSAAQAPDAVAGVQFEKWTEPAEGAFSCEVPTGWKVTGGLQRKPITAEFELVLISPDEQVMVRIGDLRMFTKYVEQNEVSATNGNQEGDVLGGGVQIKRFMPGADFAAYYVQMAMGQICSNLRLIEGRDRRDHIQTLAQQGLLQPSMQYSAGEVTYTCQANGQTYTGYQYAITYASLQNRDLAPLWNVDRFFGYAAPADKVKLADAVLQRALATMRVDMTWYAIETKTNKQIAKQNQEYLDWQAKLWRETRAEIAASQDRRSEQVGDVLRGQTQVRNPQTGQVYKVQSGYSYYWLDPNTQTIVGTNIPYQPSVNFGQMVQGYQ
jgi:uncharacterized protein YbdZ (MbtH family)